MGTWSLVGYLAGWVSGAVNGFDAERKNAIFLLDWICGCSELGWLSRWVARAQN